MHFEPSEHSGHIARRNWSFRFPERSLITGSEPGPIPGNLKWNASLLSSFLGKIPFPVTINSAYRSPSTNAEIGGAGTSQHTNALAVDIQPPPFMPNWALATWLWVYQIFFPEIDQVIWYTHKSHVHVGICPWWWGAKGCVKDAPRRQWKVDTGSGSLTTFIPTTKDILKSVPIVPPTTLVLGVGIGVAAFSAYYFWDEIKDLWDSV